MPDLSEITRGVYDCQSDEISYNPSKLRATILQMSQPQIETDIYGWTRWKLDSLQGFYVVQMRISKWLTSNWENSRCIMLFPSIMR